MAFAFLKGLKRFKLFLPQRLKRIPLKPYGFQFFNALLCKPILIAALLAHPTSKLWVIWIQLWNTTMSFAPLERLQLAELLIPLRIKGRPFKPNSFQSQHFFRRKLSSIVTDAKAHNPARKILVRAILCRNIAMTFPLLELS